MERESSEYGALLPVVGAILVGIVFAFFFLIYMEEPPKSTIEEADREGLRAAGIPTSIEEAEEMYPGFSDIEGIRLMMSTEGTPEERKRAIDEYCASGREPRCLSSSEGESDE